jgi:hypothetical protein
MITAKMAKNLSLPVPHRHRLSCLLFLILRFINDNYGNFGDVLDTIFRMTTPIPIPFSTPSSDYMSPPFLSQNTQRHFASIPLQMVLPKRR